MSWHVSTCLDISEGRHWRHFVKDLLFMQCLSHLFSLLWQCLSHLAGRQWNCGRILKCELASESKNRTKPRVLRFTSFYNELLSVYPSCKPLGANQPLVQIILAWSRSSVRSTGPWRWRPIEPSTRYTSWYSEHVIVQIQTKHPRVLPGGGVEPLRK